MGTRTPPRIAAEVSPRPRWRWVALAWALAATACGGSPPPSEPVVETVRHVERAPDPLQPFEIDHVVLVQLDGLTPDMLRGYLSLPASRGDGRLLAHLLGATPAAGAPVRFERARLPRVALAPLPGAQDTASATLLTGLPPREHKVRAEGQPLAPDARSLFDAVGRGRGDSICVGFPDCGTATVKLQGVSDAVRVSNLAKALGSRGRSPALIALRLNGLARALEAGGVEAGLRALGQMDTLLHTLADAGPPGERTVWVIASGAASLPLSQPKGVSVPQLLGYLRKQPGLSALTTANLQASGGLIRLTELPQGADRAAAKALAGLPVADMVLLRDLEGVSVFDPALDAPRPLTAVEVKGYPDLERRVLMYADPGDVIALAAEGVVYLPPGRAPGKVRQGGATVEESAVAVVFAGPPLARAPLGALAEIPLEAVAPTVLDILDIGAIKLGPDVEALSQGDQIRPRAITPTSTRWISCREAGEGGGRVEVPCGSVIRRTRDARAAAEALLLRTIAEARADAPEAEIAQRLALAAWLDPYARWPRGADDLKALWPRRPLRGRSPGGVLVFAGGEGVEIPGLGAAMQGLDALGQAEILPVQRLPLTLNDEITAAMVARVTGASATIWGSEEAGLKITAPLPMLGRLEGPAWSTTALAAGASQEARLITMASAIHLAMGLSALETGFADRAIKYLSSVEGLPSEVEPWRQLSLGLAYRLRPVEDKSEADPVAALEPGAGWPGAVDAAMRTLSGEGPGIPTEGEWGGRESTLLGAVRVAIGPDASLCDQAPRADRISALAQAAEMLEKLELPALAARARIRKAALMGDQPEAATAELAHALTLVEPRWAGWLRRDVAARVLNTALYAPWMRGLEAREALASRAAQVVLRRIQADVIDARAEGTPPEIVRARLSALLDGSTAGLPQLQRQTLEMAVAGDPLERSALIRKFLVEGAGIGTLLTPEGPGRLRITAGLIEILADPPRRLGVEMPAEERALGLAVAALLGAGADVLQGQLPDAMARIEGANLLVEKHEALPGREAALKAGGERLAAWGPQIQIAARAARVALLMASSREAEAREVAESMLRDARAFAVAEARRDQVGDALDRHIDGVVQLSYWMIEVMLASEPSAEASALKQMRKAARRVDMRLPKGAPRGPARWWVLAGVVARDIAWAIDVQRGGAAPSAAQVKAWKGIRAGMEALALDWDAALESRILRTLLAFTVTAQRALPDLVAGGTWYEGAYGQQALKGLGRQLGQISASGEPLAIDRLILAQLQGVLADPKALGDGARFAAAWGKVIQRQRQGLSAQDPAPARVLLILESVAVATQGKRWREVLALAEQGPALAKGTALDEVGYLWPALKVMAYQQQGQRAQVGAALDAVGDACPNLRWQLQPLRAVSAANASAFNGAVEQYIAGAQQAGFAGIASEVALTLTEGDGRLEMKLEVPLLSMLLGEPTGTVNLSAGYQANGGPVEPVKVQVLGQGDAVEAEIEGVSLRGWRALIWGDEAGLQGAMRRLSVIFAAKGWQIREPMEAVWLGAMAELHGHRRLGRWLIEGAARQAAGRWPDSRAGTVTVCEGDGPSGSELYVASSCKAPALWMAALPAEARGPVAQWVALRMKAREGEGLDSAAMQATLAAGSEAAPSLVPEWSLPLTGALSGAKVPPLPDLQAALVKAHGGDAAAIETAAAGGYACELLLHLLEHAPASVTLAEVARSCGASPFAVAGLTKGLSGAQRLTVAWPIAVEALEMLAEIRGPGPAPQIWPLARRMLAVDHESWQGERVEAATRLAQAAHRLKDPAEALHAEVVALAVAIAERSAPPVPADELLVKAMEMRPPPPSLPFLKRLVFAAPEITAQRALATRWLGGLAPKQ